MRPAWRVAHGGIKAVLDYGGGGDTAPGDRCRLPRACRATSWPTPRCRRPPRPAPATPTCGFTASVTEIIQLRDGELETSVVSREVGLAVRVIVDGTWGFASHAELAPDGRRRDRAPRGARWPRTLAALNAERVELAPEPVYADATWVSNYQIDPFDVPTADKIAVLEDYSGRLLAADGVDHVSAGLHAVKEQTFYADTFGSSITQQRVRVQPTLEAVTVDAAAGSFDSMRTLAPPTARGWEAVAGDDIWNWTDELAEMPSLLAEKIKAPSVAAGPHRSGDRPDQPVADHPRIHRPRNRIRPRDRLRGRLCRHVVRDARQAGHACATARR